MILVLPTVSFPSLRVLVSTDLFAAWLQRVFLLALPSPLIVLIRLIYERIVIFVPFFIYLIIIFLLLIKWLVVELAVLVQIGVPLFAELLLSLLVFHCLRVLLALNTLLCFYFQRWTFLRLNLSMRVIMKSKWFVKFYFLRVLLWLWLIHFVLFWAWSLVWLFLFLAAELSSLSRFWSLLSCLFSTLWLRIIPRSKFKIRLDNSQWRLFGHRSRWLRLGPWCLWLNLLVQLLLVRVLERFRVLVERPCAWEILILSRFVEIRISLLPRERLIKLVLLLTTSRALL